MISKEVLKKVLLEQKGLFKGNYLPRTKLEILQQKSMSNLIIIISGIRRCGKSVLLHQFKSTQKEQSYYLNFDDERLINFEVSDFETLYQCFVELFGEEKTFYFDEIQNIPGWESFVRRLHDHGNKIYITGSNARLFSKELGTKLTGRYLQLELFPASFKEFLAFSNHSLTNSDLLDRAKLAKLNSLFSDYMAKGGFFSFLETQEKDFLKTLYENIIYKDIISRHSLSPGKGLKDIYHYLTSNTAKQFSYTTLKSIASIASVSTIADYISYLEDSYLLFTIPIYDHSLKRQLINPKKAYVIDTGLADSISFKFSSDFGRIIENIVFLELKRNNNEIYYFKGKNECDFLIRKGLRITGAMQVSKSLTDPIVRQREIIGLVEAMDKFGLKKGMIITENEETTIKTKGKEIVVLPIVKWLIEDKLKRF